MPPSIPITALTIYTLALSKTAPLRQLYAVLGRHLHQVVGGEVNDALRARLIVNLCYGMHPFLPDVVSNERAVGLGLGCEVPHCVVVVDGF